MAAMRTKHQFQITIDGRIEVLRYARNPTVYYSILLSNGAGTRLYKVANTELAEKIIELLLQAYFTQQAPDRMEENAYHASVPLNAHARNYEYKIYLRPASLVAPALALRTHGPAHFQPCSMSTIKDQLREFFRNNFKYVYQEIGERQFSGPIAENVSAQTKIQLLVAFCDSTILAPEPEIFAFPLTPMNVIEDYNCDDFFIIEANSIVENNAADFIKNSLNSEKVNAWIGITSPNIQMAKKRKRIVLGALALALIRRDRHAFTLGKVVQNYIRLRERTITCSSTQHTPPIGHKIEITTDDKPWLDKLSTILNSNSAIDRRKAKALEYYYRAWFLDGSDRCPVLFMVLDAIFGQGKGRYEEKIRTGIAATLGNVVDGKRLGKLLLIRNQILHGGAPDIYSSSNYVAYCKAYEVDPVSDLDLLTERCLREHIFGKKFRQQSDPFKETLEQLKIRGVAVSTSPENLIFADAN